MSYDRANLFLLGRASRHVVQPSLALRLPLEHEFAYVMFPSFEFGPKCVFPLVEHTFQHHTVGAGFEGFALEKVSDISGRLHARVRALVSLICKQNMLPCPAASRSKSSRRHCRLDL
jgi:hypothetical protein